MSVALPRLCYLIPNQAQETVNSNGKCPRAPCASGHEPATVGDRIAMLPAEARTEESHQSYPHCRRQRLKSASDNLSIQCFPYIPLVTSRYTGKNVQSMSSPFEGRDKISHNAWSFAAFHSTWSSQRCPSATSEETCRWRIDKVASGEGKADEDGELGVALVLVGHL